MFEARLVEGKIFRNIIDSIKDLVTDANIECTTEEIAIQCMDSAHVSLVSVQLSAAAFDHYRCDRQLNLGINSANMSKVFKMMGADDIVVLKAEDDGDVLSLMFESTKSETIADFGKLYCLYTDLFLRCIYSPPLTQLLSPLPLHTELKLMDIDGEQLGIPDTPYKCSIKMPSEEFQRIVRDLQVLGDTCTISCTKEGIRFSVSGSIGTGNILTRANATDDAKEAVVIDMEEPVELNFALRYLAFFTKATKLSDSVIICLSPEVPMVVEYPIGDVGGIKFYLAPKIEEDGDGEE